MKADNFSKKVDQLMSVFYSFFKKLYRLANLFLLLLIGQIDAFIIEGTLIKTADKGLLAVEELKKGDFVCSCDKTGMMCNAQILSITKFEINNCLEVTIESDFSFLTSNKQIFFEPKLKRWCYILSLESVVDSNSKIYQCTEIAFIKKLVHGYKIEVSSPHNFFITEREILVHNFLPIIVTLSFSFDLISSITLSGFGLFVGIFQIYNYVNKTHENASFIWKDLFDDRYLTTWNLPGEGDGWVKLPNGQGWKDPDGNIWKRDHKHKDTGRTSRPCPHWDVSNKKGKKIREVDYDGKEIWPNGPKNKNKKS